MKRRAENVEPAQVLGYLANKVLYCSRACATARGQGGALPVDVHEYQALAETGAVDRTAVVCPVCGSEYPFELAEDETRS